MPAVATKNHRDIESEDGSNGQAETSWSVMGAATEEEARTAIRDEITTLGEETVAGLGLLRVRVRRLGNYGGGHWSGRAVYGYAGPEEFQPAGTDEVRYDLGGGSQRITHSLETISATPASGEPTIDFKNAINVVNTGDGMEVQGVEISSPELRMSRRIVAAASSVDAAYMLQALNLYDHTNNALFKGWAIGTVRFQGLRTRPRGDGNVEIEQEFLVSPSGASIAVGNGITVPSKPGHAHLWTHSKPTAPDADTPLAPEVVQANVERIFDPGDFSLLTP